MLCISKYYYLSLIPAWPPVNGTASIPALYKSLHITTELIISPQHIRSLLQVYLNF